MNVAPWIHYQMYNQKLKTTLEKEKEIICERYKRIQWREAGKAFQIEEEEK